MSGRRVTLALAVLGVLAASLGPVAPASAAVTCPTVVAGVVTPAPAPGVDWTGCVLTGADLAGADLTDAVLTSTNLTRANLSGANLTRSVLRSANASVADFQGATLVGADLTLASVASSLFGHADLTGAVLDRTNAASASFDHAVLTSVLAPGASLFSTSMIGTTLTDARLGTATLQRVRGSAVVVGATPPTLPAGFGIRAGVVVGPYATLPGVDLHGQDLTGLSLTGARLSASDLTSANLTGVNLTSAVLTAVNLSGTDLTGAVLTRVHATGITGVPMLPAGWTVTQGYLVGPYADLSDARLTGVDLTGRDLTGATMVRTELVGANLTGANLTLVTLDLAVITDSTITGATLNPASLLSLRTAALTGAPAFLSAGWRVVRGVIVGPQVRIWSVNLDHLPLAGIDLTGASIQGGVWDGVDLTGANFTGATLQSVRLTGAHLASANFTRATLDDVSLDSSYLRFAKFAYATLTGVNLAFANLNGATGMGTAVVTNLFWANTRCPDGTMSEMHVSSNCLGPRDLVAPIVRIGTWAPYQTSASGGNRAIPLRVDASDSGTGVVWLQSRERSTLAGRSTWSAWSDPLLSDPAEHRIWAGGSSERRTCVQVRAVDGAGNWSAWSRQTCSTWMTDDIDMFWSTQWRRTDRVGWFNETFARTWSYGASMHSSSSRTVGRLGVAALGCPTCGSVALYVGATRVRTVSLARSTTARIVVTLPAFATARTGVVRLVVTSHSKLVRIDGILIARS